MKRVVAVLLLVGSALALSGCVVEPVGPYGYGRPGPGWCYYHPYRC
jgi:hypothetical protein